MVSERGRERDREEREEENSILGTALVSWFARKMYDMHRFNIDIKDECYKESMLYCCLHFQVKEQAIERCVGACGSAFG